MSKRLAVYILFVYVLARPSLVAQQGAASKPQKISRIAILNLLNDTNSEDYSWMSTSLSDSVYQDMHQIFIFDRPNVEKTQELGSRLLPSIKYFNDDEFLKFCFATKVDYIIYGNYQLLFDGKKYKKILINTNIYSRFGQTTIASKSVEIATDATMFKKTKTISADFVTSIKEYVQGLKEKKAGQLRLKTEQERKQKHKQKAAKAQNSGPLLFGQTGAGNFLQIGGGYYFQAVDIFASVGVTKIPTVDGDGTFKDDGVDITLSPSANLALSYNFLLSKSFFINAGLTAGFIFNENTGLNAGLLVGPGYRFGKIDFFFQYFLLTEFDHSAIGHLFALGLKYRL